MGTEEQRVYFGVFDFGGEPSVVTAAVGLAPTRAWVKGDPHPDGTQRRCSHDRWEFELGASAESNFETMIEDLLDALESRSGGVRTAASRWNAGICCVGYYQSTFNPDLHLPAAVIGRAARLNLSIDFDVYFIGAGKVDR